MHAVQVARARWAPLLESVSAAARAQAARVEATGVGLGAVASGHLPLTGIAYDVAADAIALSFDGLERRIDAPRAMYVEQDGAALAGLQVVDGTGAHHVVQFTTALELPAV